MNSGLVAAVVIPFLDESPMLRGTLADLARSCRTSGVSPAQIAVIGVDNGSRDDSMEAFLAAAQGCGFGSVIAEESGGAVVSARAHGFQVALVAYPHAQLLVSLDADTRPGNAWLREALILRREGADAVSYIGSFPSQFWDSVPKLMNRYANEVGTIFFDPETSSQVHHVQRGFHQSVFERIGRTLVDQLFAVRPEAYVRAGGHRIRLDNQGAEILHEGGRLAYQLSLVGAHCATARVDRYTTSPRRLIGEASRLFTGSSYAGPMDTHRTQSDASTRALEGGSDELDFGDLRRYVVRNYILFQLLCHPERVPVLSSSLPARLVTALGTRLVEARTQAEDGFAAITTAAELDREFGAEIESSWCTTGLGGS